MTKGGRTKMSEKSKRKDRTGQNVNMTGQRRDIGRKDEVTGRGPALHCLLLYPRSTFPFHVHLSSQLLVFHFPFVPFLPARPCVLSISNFRGGLQGPPGGLSAGKDTLSRQSGPLLCNS